MKKHKLGMGLVAAVTMVGGGMLAAPMASAGTATLYHDINYQNGGVSGTTYYDLNTVSFSDDASSFQHAGSGQYCEDAGYRGRVLNRAGNAQNLLNVPLGGTIGANQNWNDRITSFR